MCRAVIVEEDVGDEVYLQIHDNVQEIMSEYEEENRLAAHAFSDPHFLRPPPEFEVGMALQYLRDQIGIPTYFLPESITIHLPREQHHPPPPAGYYMNAVLDHILHALSREIYAGGLYTQPLDRDDVGYVSAGSEEENDGDFPFERDNLRILRDDRVRLNFVALRDNTE